MPLPPRPPPKKKIGGGPPDEVIIDRARGALLGLAVGDALGATLKGKGLAAPPFPKLHTGHNQMTGGGPCGLTPGQVSDETHQAILVAQSLRTLRAFNADDLIQRYRSWASVAFDLPDQVKEVLEHGRSTGFPLESAKAVWLKHQKRANSNSPLARAAPIGVLFSRETDLRAKTSADECALTHYDPRCQLACVALNSVIGHSIHRVKETKEQLVSFASSEMATGAAHFGKKDKEFVRDTNEALALLRADLKLAADDDPKLYGPELHVHQTPQVVRVAFRYAFWHFFHAPSFEAALVDVVNRGGDTDANAAVTGALLGAFYGEKEIPARWKAEVLGALEWGKGPFANEYHPKRLLEIFEPQKA